MRVFGEEAEYAAYIDVAGRSHEFRRELAASVLRPCLRLLYCEEA